MKHKAPKELWYNSGADGNNLTILLYLHKNTSMKKNQVDSTIAQKKVQSLLQKGYTVKELARLTDLDRNTIKNVSMGKSKMIKYDTHIAIERVYAQDQARELYEEQMEQDAIDTVNDIAKVGKIIRIIAILLLVGGIIGLVYVLFN